MSESESEPEGAMDASTQHGGRSKVRERWSVAGNGAISMVRQAKFMTDVTSALVAESGEWPFYLTAPNGGAHLYSNADLVEQYVNDYDMLQLENRCVCTLDLDDDVLDLTKTMEESTVGMVFSAHAQVMEFLRTRRAASARRSLDMGLEHRRTSIAQAREERDRQMEQIDAREEEDDPDHELTALEEDVDAQTSGRSGKGQISSGRTHSMESAKSSSSEAGAGAASAAAQPPPSRRGSGSAPSAGPSRPGPPHAAGVRGTGSSADATPGAASPSGSAGAGGASSVAARRRSMGLIRAGNALATPRGRGAAALPGGRPKDRAPR